MTLQQHLSRERVLATMTDLSSENDSIRELAEMTLKKYIDHYAEEVCFHLASELAESSHSEDLRAELCFQTASLFRGQQREDLWDKLSKSSHLFLQSSVFNSLLSAQGPKLREALGLLKARLVTLALTRSSDYSLTELLSLVRNDRTEVCCSGYSIISQIYKYLDEVKTSELVAALEKDLSRHCVPRAPEALLVECFTFLVSLTYGKSDPSWKRLKPFYGAYILILKNLDSEDHETQKRLLNLFQDLIEASPEFVSQYCYELLSTIFTYTSSDEESVRLAAFDCLTSASLVPPRIPFEKYPDFAMKIVKLCFKFLRACVEKCAETLYDDEEIVFGYETGDSKVSKNPAFISGAFNLERLANAKPGEVLEALWEIIDDMLDRRPSRVSTISILVAIASVAEVIPITQYEAQSTWIFPLILDALRSHDSQIQIAGCEALCQLIKCAAFRPRKEDIVPILSHLRDVASSSLLQVKASGLETFTRFIKSMKPHDLEPIAQTLVTDVIRLLDSAGPYSELQNYLVTLFATIATKLGEKFKPMYPLVMRELELMIGGGSRSDTFLASRVYEVAAELGSAVGVDMFEPEASQMLTSLVTLRETDSLSSQLFLETFGNAFCCICGVLKQKALPWLDELMPRLVQEFASLREHFIADYQHKKSIISDYEVERFAFSTQGPKYDVYITLHFFTMIAEAMDVDFIRFTGPIANVVIDYFVLDLNSFDEDEFYKQCLVTLAALLECLYSPTSDVYHAQTLPLRKRLLSQIQSIAFGPTCRQQRTARNKHAIYRGVALCIEAAGPSTLQAPVVQLLLQQALHSMEQAAAGETLQGACSDSSSIPPSELFGGFEPRHVDLQAAYQKLIAVLMKTHPDEFLATGETVCQSFILRCMHPSNPPSVQVLAFYLLDDILEHLKDRGYPLWAPYMDTYLMTFSHPDPGMRQAAFYGVVHAAKCSGFNEDWLRRALDLLVANIEDHCPDDEANVSAIDNAIAAMGSILFYSRLDLGSRRSSYWHLWLDHLPLKKDFVEGQKINEYLMQHLTDNFDSLELTPSHILKVLRLVATIYQSVTSSETIDDRILTFIRCQANRVTALERHLDVDTKKKLELIWCDSNLEFETGKTNNPASRM